MQPKDSYTVLLMPFMFLFILILTFLLFVFLPSSDKSLTTYVNIIQNLTLPFYFLFFLIKYYHYFILIRFMCPTYTSEDYND